MWRRRAHLNYIKLGGLGFWLLWKPSWWHNMHSLPILGWRAVSKKWCPNEFNVSLRTKIQRELMYCILEILATFAFCFFGENQVIKKLKSQHTRKGRERDSIWCGMMQIGINTNCGLCLWIGLSIMSLTEKQPGETIADSGKARRNSSYISWDMKHRLELTAQIVTHL